MLVVDNSDIHRAGEAKLKFCYPDPADMLLFIFHGLKQLSSLTGRASAAGQPEAIASATGNRAIMTTGAGGLNWHLADRDTMEDDYGFSVLL